MPDEEGHHKRLIIHLGLPKTATTFLQYQVFKPLFHKRPGYVYVIQSMSKRKKDFLKLLCHLQRADEADVPDVSSTLASGLSDLLAASDNRDATAFISNENISLNAKEVWNDGGPTPDRVAERLRNWSIQAGYLEKGSVKVLLGIRRQDQWVPSRYAQSAPSFPQFSQSDLEARLDQIIAGDLTGSLSWIDYAAAYAALSSRFGNSNVFVMPMESLDDSSIGDRSAFLSSLGSFLGEPDLLETYRVSRPTDADWAPQNSLAVEANTWQLKDREDFVHLDRNRASGLRERFRASNEELVRRTGVELGRLGY